MNKFRKTGYITAAAIAGVLSASAASATVYDFDPVAGVTEMGVADGTVVNAGGLVGVAGITISSGDAATATFVSKTGSAYFDAGGGGAGLGVCQVLDASDQCDPSNDDNVQLGEAVGLNFGTGVLNSLTFSDEGHIPFTTAVSFLYSLNGASSFIEDSTDASGVWAPVGLNLADTVGIWIGFGGKLQDQFYIAAANYEGTDPNGGPDPVPLPAGGLLLLTALAGLGAARKRAKKS